MKSFASALSGSDVLGGAALGLSWTVVGFAISQVLLFAANLALIRPLFPDVFGFLLLVQVLVTGLIMFSDAGLIQSAIQNKRGDEDDFLKVRVGAGDGSDAT